MAAPIRMCATCFRYFGHSIRRIHTSRWLGSDDRVRVRFAPSPTGYLHLGGLRTALYNYLFAKARGGTFILRIEDTDQSRVIPGAVEKLETMLQWTGVIPDEGPFQGGDYGPYVQSERLELYQESAKTLIQNGSAYYCFCTPKRLDLLRRDAIRCGETPRYDNRCRHLQPGEVKDKLASKAPYVVRLKLEPTVEPWEDMIKGPVSHNVADIEGDPILIKSDGFPTYHLANVVDDHYMGISYVLRGDEWQPSTPKHTLLYKAFGWKAPHFAHLPLIINKDGTKLSKRQGDINIEHFKEQGYLPQAVLSYVTTIGGGFDCDTSNLTLDELVQHFQMERVKKHHGRLDPLFLDNANQNHLTRIMDSENRALLVLGLQALLHDTYRQKMTANHRETDVLGQDYLLHVLQWAVSEDRITKLADLLHPSLAFLWEMPSKDQIKQLQTQHPDLLNVVQGCLRVLEEENEADFEKDKLGPLLRGQATVHHMKIKDFMHMMRQLLSGLKDGPPVAEMVAVMGKTNTVQRLRHSVALLSS